MSGVILNARSMKSRASQIDIAGCDDVMEMEQAESATYGCSSKFLDNLIGLATLPESSFVRFR